jgi:hypothetical protein
MITVFSREQARQGWSTSTSGRELVTGLDSCPAQIRM